MKPIEKLTKELLFLLREDEELHMAHKNGYIPSEAFKGIKEAKESEILEYEKAIKRISLVQDDDIATTIIRDVIKASGKRAPGAVAKVIIIALGLRNFQILKGE